MANGIYVALSAAVAQGTALETTAQNLANANTTGFRGARTVFHEALARDLRRGGRLDFVGVAAQALDPTRGAARSTGNALDVVLPERSFLAVETSRGERYTRAGNLHVAPDGALATAAGDHVLGADRKPIRLPAGATARIDESGAVFAGEERVATLRLVSFAREAEMVPEGATLLAAAPGDAPGAVTGPLAVGAVEASNVAPVEAMAQLLTASRTFDAFERAIDAFRDADRLAARDVPSSGG